MYCVFSLFLSSPTVWATLQIYFQDLYSLYSHYNARGYSFKIYAMNCNECGLSPANLSEIQLLPYSSEQISLPNINNIPFELHSIGTKELWNQLQCRNIIDLPWDNIIFFAIESIPIHLVEYHAFLCIAHVDLYQVQGHNVIL